MVTDNPLRNRLHHQIDNLSADKLRFLERLLAIVEEYESTNILEENATEYHPLGVPDTASAHDDITGKINSQEEWFQYVREIEEGEFTPLDEANLHFEKWKAGYIKDRL